MPFRHRRRELEAHKLEQEEEQPSQPKQHGEAEVVEGPFGNFIPIPDPSKPKQCTVLGEGSYGFVILCRSVIDGRKVALKVFKGKTAVTDIQHEASMMKLCATAPEAHWFPKLLEEHFESSPLAFLAVEWWGCSLLSFLQKNGGQDADIVRAISCQLRAALCQLHGLQVVHLDLKPGNILWLNEALQLKLADFGMSENFGTGSHSSASSPSTPRFREYVTHFYRPPELWNVANAKDLRKNLTPAVDLWSYGCIVYECAAGSHLMASMHEHGSTKQTIQAWCQSFKVLTTAKGSTLRKGGDRCSPEARLILRLSKAQYCIRSTILSALHPDPAVRKWKS